MNRNLLIVAAVFASLTAAPAVADVWDTAGDSDDNNGTDNTLVHGSVQVHDLGVRPGPVADQDWYIVVVPPYSSYEVLLDGLTGDISDSPMTFDRLDAGGVTVVQTGTYGNGAQFVRRLAWINNTASPETSYLRVANPACVTTCTSSDQYTIRARETTIFLARFNNAGSQTTILLSQNASDIPVTALYYYWNAAGTLLQTGSLGNFAAKSLNVFPVANFGTLAGQAGHITVAHNGPYGTWNVKSVALEPATGFSFDTPGVIRP